jgi:hypothetical protein
VCMHAQALVLSCFIVLAYCVIWVLVDPPK